MIMMRSGVKAEFLKNFHRILVEKHTPFHRRSLKTKKSEMCTTNRLFSSMPHALFLTTIADTVCHLKKGIFKFLRPLQPNLPYHLNLKHPEFSIQSSIFTIEFFLNLLKNKKPLSTDFGILEYEHQIRYSSDFSPLRHAQNPFTKSSLVERAF